jgi:hypothetical protein
MSRTQDLGHPVVNLTQIFLAAGIHQQGAAMIVGHVNANLEIEVRRFIVTNSVALSRFVP